MTCRSVFLVLCGVIAAWLAAAPAEAVRIDLHPYLCIEGAERELAQIGSGAYRIPPCRAASRADGWTVLRLTTPGSLRALPSDWRLLLDQNRFDQLRVVATARDGKVQRIGHDPSAIGEDWAPGNALSLPIHMPGRDVAGLTIAFHGLDGPLFIREVVALDAAAERARAEHWLLLIGLFVGAIVSALAYNSVIYVGQRYSFQRWYIVWAASALCYGALWTNLLGFVSSTLVGPHAVRVEGPCLGALVASGTMFLINLLEPGTTSRILVIAARVTASAALVAGIATGLDAFIPAVPADRWLNAVLFGNALWVFATAIHAIRRGSRIVWLYLAGWIPVLAVYLLRLTRNLGWLPQSDAVDMGTFVAIALESVILSVTIAYRFRFLRRERDAATSAITSLQIETDVLRRAAHTDFLTALGNRAAFQAELEAIAPETALFLIDVDHLKEVNDGLGHQHGDALLIHIAARLRAIVPASMIVARIGGDEFAILVPNTREGEIAAALDQLQGEAWSYAGRSHSLSLSIGHARAGLEATVPATVYQQADFALYRAKHLGRGRRDRYDPVVAGLLDLETSLAADVPHAFAAGEFSLHYQPIVRLSDGAPVGAEALLRWQHPVHGQLTPQNFGSLLADEAFGPLLQDHVLTMALRRMQTLPGSVNYLSVNFTGIQLRGASAAQHILNRLAESGVAPGRLCVEVTEGVVLDRSGSAVAEALRVLHAAGVRIALDDFGTGYASLVHLQQIPVDMLKIDRSFVASLDSPDEQTRKIVRSIVSLSRALQKQVIAEGIETEVQRTQLQRFGCSFGQGYLFGRPQADLSSGDGDRHRKARTGAPAIPGA